MFGGAVFKRDALFGRATFTDSAGFDKATFAGNALFGRAIFRSDAVFIRAVFTGNAMFDEAAVFSGDAVFNGVTFGGCVRFKATLVKVRTRSVLRAPASAQSTKAMCGLGDGAFIDTQINHQSSVRSKQRVLSAKTETKTNLACDNFLYGFKGAPFRARRASRRVTVVAELRALAGTSAAERA